VPTTTELTIQIEDHPGTLGKLCRALANHQVNIVALHAAPDERRTQLHLIVDDLAEAKAVLGNEGFAYTECDVVQATLPHRSGELANAASRLGEAKINIKSVYSGIDPTSNSPLVFFGVADALRAATILDHAAGALFR
jgi:hypothetical protein